MFPEYRELITKLKTSDRHFSHLFDKHNNLDQKIQRMEAHAEPGTPEEIEVLKKRKTLIERPAVCSLEKSQRYLMVADHRSPYMGLMVVN